MADHSTSRRVFLSALFLAPVSAVVPVIAPRVYHFKIDVDGTTGNSEVMKMVKAGMKEAVSRCSIVRHGPAYAAKHTILGGGYIRVEDGGPVRIIRAS